MKHIKSIGILLSIIASSVALSACNNYNRCKRGSGHIATQNRPIAAFDRIDISDAFKVILKQDTTAANITVTADDNLIKYIKTNVTGGKLHIYIRQNICNSNQMVINIPVRMLIGVKASDGAEVVTEGKITAKDIYLNASDGSKITFELTANHVATTESDAAEVTLKGQASANDIKMSDGSKLNAADFVTGASNVLSSDGSFAELNILNTLDVRSSDGAVVKYHGNPQSVNTNKSDGASVEKVN